MMTAIAVDAKAAIASGYKATPDGSYAMFRRGCCDANLPVDRVANADP